MSTHIWRKHNSFISAGYMWVVLNQANILKRHPGYSNTIYTGQMPFSAPLNQLVEGSSPSGSPRFRGYLPFFQFVLNSPSVA